MSATRGLDVESNQFFLTTTDKTWEELNRLPKVPEWIASWQGTLYCEKADYPLAREDRLQTWED